MAVFRLVRFLFIRIGTIIKAQEKLVYGETDTVVSGLKRGGSYQFKAVYEPDDKDGQTYYETVTSEAATRYNQRGQFHRRKWDNGGGSSSGGRWNQPEAAHLPEEVEQPEAAHLPEAVERPEAGLIFRRKFRWRKYFGWWHCRRGNTIQRK